MNYYQTKNELLPNQKWTITKPKMNYNKPKMNYNKPKMNCYQTKNELLTNQKFDSSFFGYKNMAKLFKI